MAFLQPYDGSLRSTEYAFLTVDPRSLLVGLCVQVSEFRFRVYNLNMAMDFWNWVEDFWYIPQFYTFLYKLSDIFPLKVFGYDITKIQHEQLYLGEVHPLSIVSPGITKYAWVVEALTDLDHEGQDARWYTKQYGRWLFRVHREFKKYRDQINTTIAAFEGMIHV